MNIALVRHLAPEVQAGICYGRLDVPARPDDTGAQAIVDGLAGLAARSVWSSPARRCLGLAEAIAGGKGAALRQDARLQELDFGAWEGQPWDDVPREALDRWAADPLAFAPPGGESGAALLARARSFHRYLLIAGEDCVVVSHGGPLKLLAALLRGRPADLLAPAPAFGWIDRIG